MWDLIHDRTPHARRPAVRPVHDQAADAVLPVLARGAALRPDGVPRVGASSSASCGAARRRSSRTRSAEMRDHATLVQYAVIFDRIFRFAITGTPRAQLRRARRPAAVRVAAPARRAALDRHPARHRLGRRARMSSSRSATRSTSSTGARSTGRRSRTGSPPTSCVRRHAHAEPGVELGARAAGRGARRRRRRATPTRCWTTSSRCRCSTRRSSKKMAARHRVDGRHHGERRDA